MFRTKTLSALIAAAFLAFIACASIFFTTASAAELEKVTSGFVYEDGAKTIISDFNLPEGVTGDYQVVIPAGVKSIGKEAFKGDALKGIILNDGLESIDDYAFTQSSVMSVVIPESVTRIGEHAFNGCTSLQSVTFADGAANLSLLSYSFANCNSIRTITIPDGVTVSQFAFDGCTSLNWVYVGNGCKFINSAGDDFPDAVFFPVNTSLSIVFPSAEQYNAMRNQADATFYNNNGRSATYIVKVIRHIGDSKTAVDERLHGEQYNYVRNAANGTWNTDTAYSTLPVQDPTYSQTIWYGERTFENSVSYDDVNSLLANEKVSEINLYCHETVTMPKLPADPVSWVYKSDITYDIKDLSQVLKAIGCEEELTEAQLSALAAALDVNIVFADEKGNVAETPAAINGNGVYSVTLSLKEGYGSFSQPVSSTVTVNVDTSGFTVVMIVLLVLGILAVAITASTAVIRKRVQARNKKKQLTQKEVLDKYRAIGGETTLI